MIKKICDGRILRSGQKDVTESCTKGKSENIHTDSIRGDE